MRTLKKVTPGGNGSGTDTKSLEGVDIVDALALADKALADEKAARAAAEKARLEERRKASRCCGCGC